MNEKGEKYEAFYCNKKANNVDDMLSFSGYYYGCMFSWHFRKFQPKTSDLLR